MASVSGAASHQTHPNHFTPLSGVGHRTYTVRFQGRSKAHVASLSFAYADAYSRGQVAATLMQEYPSIYGGTDLTSGGNSIVIYLTSLSPSALASAQGIAPNGSIQYAIVRHTVNQLNGVIQSVASASSQLASDGIQIPFYQVDFASSTVEVEVVNPTAFEVSTLDNEFGSSNLTIVPVSKSDVTTFGRNSDSSPFNGGDNILSAKWTYGSYDYQSQCSSGFGITIGSNSDFLTAGHCQPPSTQEYNQICSTGGFCTPTGTSMGGIDANDTTAGGTDSEVSNGNGSDIIFGGAIGSPDKIPVTGHVGVTEYETDLCTSGAMDGEICSLEVTSDPQATTCINATDYLPTGQPWTHGVCHLIQITNETSGGVEAGLGDSGGPVYVPNGSGDALATGTISAGQGSLIACPANTWRGSVCSKTGLYTSLSSELATWHATLNLYP